MEVFTSIKIITGDQVVMPILNFKMEVVKTLVIISKED